MGFWTDLLGAAADANSLAGFAYGLTKQERQRRAQERQLAEKGMQRQMLGEEQIIEVLKRAQTDPTLNISEASARAPGLANQQTIANTGLIGANTKYVDANRAGVEGSERRAQELFGPQKEMVEIQRDQLNEQGNTAAMLRAFLANRFGGAPTIEAAGLVNQADQFGKMLPLEGLKLSLQESKQFQEMDQQKLAALTQMIESLVRLGGTAPATDQRGFPTLHPLGQAAGQALLQTIPTVGGPRLDLPPTPPPPDPLGGAGPQLLKIFKEETGRGKGTPAPAAPSPVAGREEQPAPVLSSPVLSNTGVAPIVGETESMRVYNQQQAGRKEAKGRYGELTKGVAPLQKGFGGFSPTASTGAFNQYLLEDMLKDPVKREKWGPQITEQQLMEALSIIQYLTGRGVQQGNYE